MADRRTSERLLVAPESLERITPDASLARIVQRTAPPCANPATEKEDRTEPMKLSFLALLAERDPAVQIRLSRRITPILELAEFRDQGIEEDDDRPTDPMILTAKFSG
ncbi:MAG TPA: hypothetical protein VFW81_00775 [Thermoanaerobaculia bacterium]|nr:hypothetical protein [Thermoanaerobaculia bacterium]